MIIDSNQQTNDAQQQVSQSVNNIDDSEIVLSVEGVSKKFCRDLKRSLFYGVKDIASELIGTRQKSDKLRKEEFWALNNVSLKLRKGEALGLVGKNGSGKSTLLRIIAGLIKPDRGTVDIKGRVAPLIALGAGFNPILTGRENIYANMSILGLSKKEIDERFDEVVEFAEIGDAIDAPVRSYSSGMAARLGFASAIHTEPDILLIDEVLAVGDIKFRQKCYRKLNQLRQRGTSFILVSHDAKTILHGCSSAVYLRLGQLVTFGKTDAVMHQYEMDLFLNGIQQKNGGAVFLPEKPKEESLGLDLTHFVFRNDRGEIVETPETGEAINFCVGYKATQVFDNTGLILIFKEIGEAGEEIFTLNSEMDDKKFLIAPGKSEISIYLPCLVLKPGVYSMTIVIRKEAFYPLDRFDDYTFSVVSNKSIGNASFYQPRIWQPNS